MDGCIDGQRGYVGNGHGRKLERRQQWPPVLGESSCRGRGTPMVEPAHSPRKPSHHRTGAAHQEQEESDATTAHSSWIDDSSSRLSSPCLTFRSSRDEESGGSDDDRTDDDRRSRLWPSSYPQTVSQASSSSSLLGSPLASERYDEGETKENSELRHEASLSPDYYSAVDDSDAWDEFHLETHPFVGERAGESNVIGCIRKLFLFELHPLVIASRVDPRPPSITCEDTASPTTSSTSTIATTTAATIASLSESEAYLELVERARHMLRREAEREVVDYFHQGDLPLPLPSNNSSSREDSPYSPIDASCRSKMMEWSFRVVGHSFPRRPSRSPRQIPEQDQCPYLERKHSIEALLIVSRAFDLVDRMSSRHFREGGGRAMDRGEYKLACMACLHLVAKTCGLYRLHDGEGGAEEEGPRGQPPFREGDGSSSLPPSPCPSATPSATGSAAPSPHDEGQTILSTPGPSPDGDDRALRGRRSTFETASIDGGAAACGPAPHPCARRPALDLLSLPGLSALCQGEHPPGQLARAERDALRALRWRVTGAAAADWHGMLMELLVLCDGVRGGPGRRRRVAEVRMRSLIHLERATEAERLLRPSLAAWAAVAHALDECDAGCGGETSGFLSTYREVVWTAVLPLCGEEEVNDVRIEVLTP